MSLDLSPREKGEGTRVTSWWIDGSRDRYDTAYFVTQRHIIKTGSIKAVWELWENHRPYGVNRKVADLPDVRREWTWATIDAALQRRRDEQADVADAYTATVSAADEDGNCQVHVVGRFDGYEAWHTVRFDMAQQWAMQELDCLNEGAPR